MKNLSKKGTTIVAKEHKGLYKSLLLIVAALSSGLPQKASAQQNLPITANENHVGLAVKNLDAEKEWYKKMFGMEEQQHFEISKMHVRTVLLRSPNGLGMELIEVKGATRKRSYKNALDAASDLGYGHWAIVVSDLNLAYKELISAGAQSVSAPAAAVNAGDSFAYVKDPEGNLIELMQIANK